MAAKGSINHGGDHTGQNPALWIGGLGLVELELEELSFRQTAKPPKAHLLTGSRNRGEGGGGCHMGMGQNKLTRNWTAGFSLWFHLPEGPKD